MERVEDGAFWGCKNVSKVYMTDLKDKLEFIGDAAFNFTYKADHLALPPNVKEIGQNAFSGWTIRKLTLNDKLERIGNFAFTKVAEKIVIPNSVKSIGSFAFCGGFNEVVIGSGVESIAENAFDGTTRYSSTNIVSVNLGNPLKLNGSIMANDNSNLWNLRVPKGSKDAYAKSNYWKQFRTITEDASLVSGNGTPEGDGEEPGGGDSGGDRKPAMDYRNVTYSFVGDTRTFKMIRVEGGGLHPFYIMQTEIPIHSQIKFGNRENILPLDRSGDDIVIKYEFRRFIDDIRAETGLDFRLPTLAEWQYASKGGNRSKGFKYSGSNDINEVAWYKDNSNGYVHDVALKQPNELGLYDMSGNYAEVASDIDDIYVIDAYDCGGSWKHTAPNCLPSSYELDSYANTRIPGTTYRNKNAIDSRYISVRLVFAEPDLGRRIF